MVTNAHDVEEWVEEAENLPARIVDALIGDSSSIELRVKVERNTVKAYGFSYDGWPVALRNNIGTFPVIPGEEKLLEWVMVGDGGATMKVTVTRNGKLVKERAESKIPLGYSKGYDAFQIKVDADA